MRGVLILVNADFFKFFPGGFIILVLFVFYRIYLPKKPNSFYGFRIELTMKNQDVWDVSNRYLANQFIIVGIVSLIVSFVAYYILQPSHMRNLFPLLIMLVGLAYTVVKSINFVKQNFNPDGTRKKDCKLPAWAEVEEQQPLIQKTDQTLEVVDENKIKTASKTTKYIVIFAMLLFLITEAFLIYFYPKLPDSIYIHFNLLGEPSPWTVSKQSGFWLMQAVLITIWTVDIALLAKIKNTVLSLLMIVFLSTISVLLISVFLYNATGTFFIKPIITLIITMLITLFLIVIAGRYKKSPNAQ
jgi:uncharacterized membrane protein